MSEAPALNPHTVYPTPLWEVVVDPSVSRASTGAEVSEVAVLVDKTDLRDGVSEDSSNARDPIDCWITTPGEHVIKLVVVDDHGVTATVAHTIVVPS